VSKELWRGQDFASDKIMATLFSFKTSKKLGEGIENSSVYGSIGDASILMASCTMLSLSLHAINGSFTPDKHRPLYLFVSMIFLLPHQAI
jgi:hypothetical protein